MAAAIRVAVVRSGLWSERRSCVCAASEKPTSRSTMAPFEIRPAVGTPRVTLAAAPDAVGAREWRDEQRAALETLCVAHCDHRDVDAGALRRESGKVRRHHDGRDVLRLHGLAAGVDAEALQHGDEALLREGRVDEAIARAVQADHE